MTQTLNTAGEPLFFPHTLVMDDAGVIRPRPLSELAAITADVAPDQLLPFVRRLINGTNKRKRQAKWSAVNRQRLELARLCLERALNEGVIATAA